MRFIYIIRFAFSSILKRGVRSALTIFGTSASIAIIILLAGIGSGLQNSVMAELKKGDTERLITVTSERFRAVQLDAKTVSTIQSTPGVISVDETADLPATLTYNGIDVTAPLYVSTLHTLTSTGMVYDAGSIPSGDEPFLVISEKIASTLGFSSPQKAIGEQVKTVMTVPDQNETTEEAPQTYRIAAVTNEKDALSYFPWEASAKVGVTVASSATVMVADPQKVPSIRTSIEELGLETTSVQDTVNKVSLLFDAIRVLLILLGGITLVVAGLGTLNTITVTLIEQTKEIGFLRLIGIRTSDVHTMFMAQSLILAVGGTSIGIVVGTVIGVIINGIASAAIHSGPLVNLHPFQIPVILILSILAAATAAGFLLGIVPARRAVRINPLRAMV